MATLISPEEGRRVNRVRESGWLLCSIKNSFRDKGKEERNPLWAMERSEFSNSRDT